MDSGIVGVGDFDPIRNLQSFIELLPGSISEKLDDFEANQETVKNKEAEYAELKRDCMNCLARINKQFVEWLDSAEKTRLDQEKRMRKFISKEKKIPESLTPSTTSSVWNNFVPARSIKTSPTTAPKLILPALDDNTSIGVINGVELGQVRVIKDLRQVPNIIVCQLESDLKHEESEKFFYIRVNGYLIQGSIPRRQKQGTLRKYRSCYHVKIDSVRCQKGAEACRFFHDPMLDKDSHDVRNFPELSRYIRGSEFDAERASGAYTDNLGDIDELASDIEHITEHEIYIFAQKLIGGLLCLMAASRKKTMSPVECDWKK